MKWLWIFRRHHEEVGALAARLISDRDERIRQLEAERRMLWDRLCMFGIGAPVFGVSAPPEEIPTAEKQSQVTVKAPLRRPSEIMRHQDALAQGRYERKQHPSRENEPVATMLRTAEMKVEG